MVQWSFVMLMPMIYIHKHRRGLLDVSRIHKMHHAKEIVVRLVLGAAFGWIGSQYLFGPASQDFLTGPAPNKLESRVIDESDTTLEYSSALLH